MPSGTKPRHPLHTKRTSAQLTASPSRKDNAALSPINHSTQPINTHTLATPLTRYIGHTPKRSPYARAQSSPPTPNNNKTPLLTRYRTPSPLEAPTNSPHTAHSTPPSAPCPNYALFTKAWHAFAKMGVSLVDQQPARLLHHTCVTAVVGTILQHTPKKQKTLQQ